MRISQYLISTLKEDPADAVVVSHKLMLRAGLIRKESAGMYMYLPLGLRALRNVEKIIREEMAAAGALEFLMPELTSADLWKESGRWDAMGPEMIRIKDRNGSEFALGPTHEEAFTNAMRILISSYKDLPKTVYQMNTKFRDEIRPRFGVMRSKEFIMKDAYSFDMDNASLDNSYQAMRKAYRRIFERCGLDTIPVAADSGSMGGSASEEFMVASEVGEEILIICPACGYQANQEKAEYGNRLEPESGVTLEKLEIVETPNVKSIEDLTSFFKCSPAKFMKSIIYLADGEPVMAVVPGDREVNEFKLKNILKAVEIELAPDRVVEEVTGAPVGFAGPVTERKIKTVFDLSVKNMSNAITGANARDKHYKGVNPARDFHLGEEGDITTAVEGDSCPQCKAKLTAKKGIEVGHIFKLGYKYTRAMNFNVLDENGREVTPTMGCYGIGVTRTVAAVVEQNHDESGIMWPIEVAPFQIHMVGIAKTDEEKESVDVIYNQLIAAGYDVLYDDRKLSPGVKFADADLLGLPVRITVGKSYFTEKMIELKNRRSGEVTKVNIDELNNKVKELLSIK